MNFRKKLSIYGFISIFFLLFSAFAIHAAGNNMGINIGGTSDWTGERLYADLIKMSRSFNQVNTAGNGSKIAVDSDGWPLSDTSFYIWHGIDQMHGTYELSFSGKAIVTGNTVGTINLTYSTGTNTSQGIFGYSGTGLSYLVLNFKNTYRDTSMPINSGVTNIKLMRPTFPGSTKSYPSTTLFTQEIQNEIAKFSTIRFMDFVATNGNMQKNWEDRTLPSYASVNRTGSGNGWQGKGGPWEHVVLLSNLTKKDVWINIPVRATDEYIRNLANLLKYGSDGVNPYITWQPNPVYPPLSRERRIYVEYSNEVWNSIFTQKADNCRAASYELLSKKDPNTGISSSPINYDKTWNGVMYGEAGYDWYKCWRYTAYRGVQISNIFRSVYGDWAMGTQIRPIFASQQGDAQGTLSIGLKFLFDYYNNAAGPFQDAPHPPSYYFYGAGGSAYWNPANHALTSLDNFFADIGIMPAGWLPMLRADGNLVTAMGLKRVAYEGGPSLDKTAFTGTNLVYAEAVKDSRMTDTVVNMHNAWSQNNGDLLVYYQGVGGYQWGFTDNIHNLDTPKLRAIDQLNNTSKAQSTFGPLAPVTISGSMSSTCNRGWQCSPMSPWDGFTAPGTPVMRVIWASYNFRTDTPTISKATLSISKAMNNAKLAVYMDGNLVATRTASGTTSMDVNLAYGTTGVTPGEHSIIIQAVSGSFSLDTISIQ